MQDNKINTEHVLDNRLKNNGLFEANWRMKKREKLHNRFSVKSFCQKAAWLKHTAFSLSFVFNIISIIGAFYGAYWAFSFMGAPTAVAALLGLVVLAMLEFVKRKSSDEVWDEYWKNREFDTGWVSLSLTLFVISAATSGFGIWQGTQDFAPKANLITTDSTLLLLQQQNATTTKGINDMSDTKWHGTITRDAQQAINNFAATQNLITDAIIKRGDSIDEKNQKITADSQMTATKAAGIALLLYFVIEILFEACMSFCSYYDFRDYLEGYGISTETIQTDEFRNSDEFRNLFHNNILNSQCRTPESGFQAIKKRMSNTSPQNRVETPPNPVYAHHTSINNSHMATSKVHVVKERVENVEAVVIKLCGEIQKFYPSRWDARVERKGKLDTMARNFENFLTEILTIIKDNPDARISEKWKGRVADYLNVFEKEIKQHL